jgi:HTH-type transcriptional regulator/antitoxin HigA
MKVKILKTEQDYREALERLETIFDAKNGSTQGSELEVLGLLIEQYEKEHFPIDMPDPVEAIKFRMEQLGYNQKDLAHMY